MSRTQLFQLRLLATVATLLAVYLLLRLLWFPGGYFALSEFDARLPAIAVLATDSCAEPQQVQP